MIPNRASLPATTPSKGAIFQQDSSERGASVLLRVDIYRVAKLRCLRQQSILVNPPSSVPKKVGCVATSLTLPSTQYTDPQQNSWVGNLSALLPEIAFSRHLAQQESGRKRGLSSKHKVCPSAGFVGPSFEEEAI